MKRLIGGIFGGVIGTVVAGVILAAATPIDFATANPWWLIALTVLVVAPPILGIWLGTLMLR